MVLTQLYALNPTQTDQCESVVRTVFSEAHISELQSQVLPRILWVKVYFLYFFVLFSHHFIDLTLKGNILRLLKYWFKLKSNCFLEPPSPAPTRGADGPGRLKVGDITADQRLLSSFFDLTDFSDRKFP